MKLKLEPVEDQTIVITGASSGIGLATAQMAAGRGARVVMIARNEEALERAAAEIEDSGGEATYVVADVSEAGEVESAAEAAISRFGGFDTWINDAGIGMYGRLEDVQLKDQYRLFDVNFWGLVHGCMAALPHLRDRGGALINLGSVESDVALPYQGIYAATKHAVKAYTDTLRLELEEEGAPVSVTLVRPSGIDTPFFRHARNYLGVEPRPTPPVYAPEVVARTILTCAERPARDVIVGAGGRMFSEMSKFAPSATDVYLEKTQFEGQKTNRAGGRFDDILYRPTDQVGSAHGDYDGHVMKSSIYTTARLHRKTTLAAMLGVGLAVAAGVKAMRAE